MICSRISCIRLTHLPTGITVKVDMIGRHRTQRSAYNAAMVMLKSKLFAILGAVKTEDVVEEIIEEIC